jgi:hypothetical protein
VCAFKDGLLVNTAQQLLGVQVSNLLITKVSAFPATQSSTLAYLMPVASANNIIHLSTVAVCKPVVTDMSYKLNAMMGIWSMETVVLINALLNPIIFVVMAIIMSLQVNANLELKLSSLYSQSTK